ncbi:MAG TPA: DUF4258 domain-containing protein [archaeon]|nr:DUF4258 domain-containing protein [archaeon]
MEVIITNHARERMQKYEIKQSDVLEAINNSTDVIEGHSNRIVYQKVLNGYVIRAVCEKVKSTVIVITVYKARKGRYEIQI